ncbi:hypothetical protein SCACP_38240 [Sporomusa carbonis]|uniref:hypothetical protein n=1 Tax=Sporomusa carbonis TaxID=3076075 RepID=UPI003A6CF24D
MDPMEDYKYLLALHLRDISKRYGLLYCDIISSKIPPEAQVAYKGGLARLFEYMSARHGLENADILAVHDTVLETVFTEFITEALVNSVLDNPKALH